MAGAIPVQTQEDIVPPPPAPIGYRLGGVLLAPAVAVTIHLALRGPFGLDLQVPESPGSSTLAELTLLTTTVFTLVLSLVAWISVLLLERGLGADRARGIWRWVAFGVFVASLLVIPTLDISAGAMWGLVAIHAAVALVLIPMMTAKGQPAAPVPTPGVQDAAHADEDHH